MEKSNVVDGGYVVHLSLPELIEQSVNDEREEKMQIVELKVKINSLAAEAALIRKQERRALKSARWNNVHRGNDASYYGLHARLRAHRVSRVRKAARASQLAFAFLVGRPYRTVERVGSSAPDWKEVAKNIRAFSVDADPDAFEAWRKD